MKFEMREKCRKKEIYYRIKQKNQLVYNIYCEDINGKKLWWISCSGKELAAHIFILCVNGVI